MNTNRTFRAIVVATLSLLSLAGTSPAAEAAVGDSSFSVDDVSVNEAAGTATFTISRSFAVDNATVEVISAADSARKDTDFSSEKKVLSFGTGQLSKTYVVAILQDNVSEAAETFTVRLLNPVGATLADKTGIGTIADDEPLPSLTVRSLWFPESATNHVVTFTILSSGPSSRPISFQVRTGGGTATAGTDFVGVASSARSIPAYSRSTTVSVTIKGDRIAEPNESFEVLLSGPTNAIIGSHGKGTIQNDD